jgi:L,D-transpeptidase ErfK/SrfK
MTSVRAEPTAELRAFLTGLILLVSCAGTQADQFLLPPSDVDLIGAALTVEVSGEETLLDIGRRYGIGHNEMVLANPAVDPWVPGKGTRAVVPGRFIIPNAARKGMVLNVPEMRLYYYPQGRGPDGKRIIVTHPVSIGRMDWGTPLGLTRVAAKVRDPAWRPPQSIKQEAAEKGVQLPDVVPAGADNPLGAFALRLGLPGYLIHSTNRPFGIGMRVTHGCVRMYPEDIGTLFQNVSVNTPVEIVDQPVKVGWLADTLFMEVHPPLEEAQLTYTDRLRQAVKVVEAAVRQHPVALRNGAIRKAIKDHSGIPVPISVAVSP